MEDDLSKFDVEIPETKLFEELKDKEEKVKVSITIDKSLLEDLNNYKKEKELKELSPMINIILKDWLNKSRKKKK